jgi:ribonuclease BN (tRNA processing enzyme)
MKFASGKETVRVQSALTRHPGGCFAYRFDGPGRGGDKALVFATDNEPPIDPQSPLLKMTRGADLLICDGQYTDEEHEKRRGWGHGTPSLCLQETVVAKAKRLLVTHFDPGHADPQLQKMEDELIAAGQKQGIDAAFARQNQEILL